MKKPSKWDTSRKLDKIYRKMTELRCSICPPNQGENAKRRSKHGNKTPRYKTR